MCGEKNEKNFYRNNRWGWFTALGLIIGTCMLLVVVPGGDSNAGLNDPAVEDWLWQNPIPQGNNLYSVVNINAEKIIAVGGVGMVLRSDDGGLSWDDSRVAGINTSALRSVDFIDTQTGWIVGDDGIALNTSDGGATWKRITSTNFAQTFHKVAFISKSTGWIVGGGGLILKTTNQGITWIPQVSNTGVDLWSVNFIDDNFGWVCGNNGVVRRTTNGGVKWDSLVSRTFSNLHDVNFLSTQIGYLVGSRGYLSRTTNGGESWMVVPNDIASTLNAISVVNANVAIAVGDSGNTISTVDGGLSWRRDSLSTTSNLFAVGTMDNKPAWIVGDNGSIWKAASSNFPVWNLYSRGTVASINDVIFFDGSSAIAVGNEGTILKTNNGGGAWLPLLSGAIYNLYSIDFWNRINGCAVGDSGTILTTSDGGFNWLLVNSGMNTSLRSVKYFDSSIVSAVGNNGSVLISNDGGKSWTNHPIGDASIFLKSHLYVDTNTILAVGNSSIRGKIFKSSDGGFTWQSKFTDHLPFLNSIYAINPEVIFAVGASKVILTTSDHGESWSLRSSPIRTDFTDIYFVNDSVGWVTGGDGTLIKTTSGGSNWYQVVSPSDKGLNTIYFIDQMVGWVFGDGGAILQTQTGGGPPIVIEPPPQPLVPSGIHLLPNYPNPYRPGIHIGTYLAFELIEGTTVTIKIYDILGRIIKEIPLGFLTEGVYNSRPGNLYAPLWDGLDNNGYTVPSGIYIYKLVTPKFQHARKLILVR